MYPENFQYFAPKELGEALNLLGQYRDKSRVLAGGMSLVPILKNRLASVPYLVDVGKISGIRQITQSGNSIGIGSMVTDYELENSALIQKKIPLISEVSHWIGDPQVRNRGTIGGSLCHADPAGDWGACVIALRGVMKIASSSRERTVDSDHFFRDSFTTAVEPHEMLTSVEFTVPSGKCGHDYQKMERKAGDFATVGIAVQLSLSENNKISYVGIGMAAVGNTSLRARKAEQHLIGKSPDAELIVKAGELAADDTDPSDDILRGSADFKREMVKVYTGRALKNSLERAGVVIP